MGHPVYMLVYVTYTILYMHVCIYLYLGLSLLCEYYMNIMCIFKHTCTWNDFPLTILSKILVGVPFSSRCCYIYRFLIISSGVCTLNIYPDNDYLRVCMERFVGAMQTALNWVGAGPD